MNSPFFHERCTETNCLEWFEDACFFFFIPVFDASFGSRDKSPRKAYVIDHALGAAFFSTADWRWRILFFWLYGVSLAPVSSSRGRKLLSGDDVDKSFEIQQTMRRSDRLVARRVTSKSR